MSIIGAIAYGGVGSSPVCTSCDYEARILSLGPFLYWKMDDASGAPYDEISESTQGSFTGTPNYQQTGLIDNTGFGTDYSIQFIGTEEFDGPVNTYTQGGTGFFPDATDWSIELWTQPSSFEASPNGVLIDMFGTTWGILLGIYTADNTLYAYGGYQGDTPDFYDNTGFPVLSFGTTYHVVLRNEANKLSAFVNGTEYIIIDDSANPGHNYVPTYGGSSATKQMIVFFRNLQDGGANSNTTLGYFDQIAVYNYSLSDTEIVTNYQIGKCQSFNPCT